MLVVDNPETPLMMGVVVTWLMVTVVASPTVSVVVSTDNVDDEQSVEVIDGGRSGKVVGVEVVDDEHSSRRGKGRLNALWPKLHHDGERWRS